MLRVYRRKLAIWRSDLRPIAELPLISSHLTVLRELHRHGSASRVDLAKSTGLSTQSLTRLTKQLLDDEILVEGERRISGRGQPAIYLSIKPSRLVSFGLVIEHDQITCVASELGGERLVYLKRRVPFAQAQAAITEATDMLKTAIGAVPADAFALGVGVSISGFFVEEGTRRIVSRNDITGWSAVDLTTSLLVPVPMQVFVENDGRAAAIGQAVDGIGKQLESFFLILMTKGIGGGFVQKGQLVRGHVGNAGEVANFVPKTPSLARPAIESMVNFLRQEWGHTPSDEDIEAALRGGDPAMVNWLEQAAASLEPAVDAIAALLDPQAVILAGRLLPSVRQALAERLKIEGVNFAGFHAPKPQILVDPRTDCLSVGASALPVAAFLYTR
jgi:predicted NBD/HSP70 family sugar kinase